MDPIRSHASAPATSAATTGTSQIGDVPVVADPDAGSVGLVKARHVTVASPSRPLALEGGQSLGPITVAYETYGTLSERRDNAILVSHALSGDAHVAGRHKPDDKRLGWWDMLIGPGKALDTERYFVICANALGGCNGTTGPASVDPATGERFGTAFPIITIADMVNVQTLLLDKLGIPKLLATIGGSMGGMKALQFAVAHPQRTHAVIAIATAAQQPTKAIAFNEVGRQAIMADPEWRGGSYYGHKTPRRGLSVARMIGHITYLSDTAMREKFGRRLQDLHDYSFTFSTDFEVESYLHHQGLAFTDRFDANSYLYITRAMDYFDLVRGKPSLAEALRGAQARFLVMSFSSDGLHPPYQLKEIVSALRATHKHVSYYEVQSDFGHDSFLLERFKMEGVISAFLSSSAATFKPLAASHTAASGRA
jgi:homoserine O-acetyltransferase